MQFETLSDACRQWVAEMNAIPQAAIERLYEYEYESLNEITPPCINDRVYVLNGDSGEIVKTTKTGKYVIKLNNGNKVTKTKEEFSVTHDGDLPMWGTMWSFGDKIDEDWVLGTYCEPHLQEMANCGFRIYESEYFGLIFGIDGAGYNFYESHWIPLYKARGINWHKKDDTEEVA